MEWDIDMRVVNFRYSGHIKKTSQLSILIK